MTEYGKNMDIGETSTIIDVNSLDFGPPESSRMIKTKIEGLVLVCRPLNSNDPRGPFEEHYRIPDVGEFIDEKIPEVMQGQTSYSVAGVLRGMHAGPEDKYIFPSHGVFYVAVVDVRKGSSTFGKSVVMKFDNSKPGESPTYGYFIRRGLANGFYVKQVSEGSKFAEYHYTVTKVYNRNTSRGFRYDDPVVNIHWPSEVKHALVLDKDLKQPSFEEFARTVDQKMYE